MHIHRSPGLTAIYNATRDRTNLRVLDLGASSAGTFNFFSSNSGRIIFEDLRDFITENASLCTEAFADSLQEYCLPKADTDKFDIILAWDFFNYLPFDNVVALLKYLSPLCQQDTFIFTIKYPGNVVPSLPPAFEIIDKHKVKIHKFSTHTREHSGFTLSQFYKHTNNFQIENSISQQEGMLAGFTEQLIRYQPIQNNRHKLTTVNEVKPLHLTDQLEKSARHYSPTLKRLQEEHDSRSILDLGMKSRQNLEAWRSAFNEVYFEDIGASVKPLSPNSQQTFKQGISPNALQFNGLSFDVIMTWDILNFCSFNQLEVLANKIRKLSHKHTLVSTLVYTGHLIPERPAKFWLNDDCTMQIENLSHQKRTTPRLTITGLMKVFGGAKMVGTYAFEEGMNSEIREFLFTVPPLDLIHGASTTNTYARSSNESTAHETVNDNRLTKTQYNTA